jgi:F-type H+-transporting ATPase subunit b
MTSWAGSRLRGAGFVLICLLILAFLPGCAIIERINHDPWLSFLFKVINFLILMAIFIKVLKKPLGNFLRNRQSKVRQALEDAEKARREAGRKMQEYERRLAHIDEEIDEIHRTLKEEGEREKARIIQEAERMAEEIKAQAQATTEQEIRVAQQILRGEVADLAVQLAEEILKKSVSKSDQKKLVEQYVDQMETLR